MTQTAAVADNTQHVNFFTLFNRYRNENTTTIIKESKNPSEHPLLNWFENSKILAVIDVDTLSAGKILGVGHVIIRFKLSNFYHDRFILLRGLLEFSRPKAISISSNTSDKTFELRVSDDQVDVVKKYLDTILSLLIKEIKFKASLNAVLKFEQSFKAQQSKLYEELRALA